MTRVRPTCGTHSLPTRRSPGLRIPNLMRTAPAAFAVMIIGCASMAGIPPLLGFVSKEFLFTALGEAPGGDWTGWVALLVAAGASVLTFAYCAKTVWGSFIEIGRAHV